MTDQALQSPALIGDQTRTDGRVNATSPQPHEFAAGARGAPGTDGGESYWAHRWVSDRDQGEFQRTIRRRLPPQRPEPAVRPSRGPRQSQRPVLPAPAHYV